MDAQESPYAVPVEELDRSRVSRDEQVVSLPGPEAGEPLPGGPIVHPWGDGASPDGDGD